MRKSNGLVERFGFWSLVAVVVALGILFYHIVEPFLISLLFAAMLSVLFRPLFHRAVKWLGGRHKAAAGLTALILLMMLLPLAGAMFLAGRELAAIGQDVVEWNPNEHPLVKDVKWYWKNHLTEDEWQQIQDSVQKGVGEITANIFDRTQAFLSNVIRFVVGLTIMFLALYYFFADGPLIVNTLRSVSPLEPHDEEVAFEQFVSVCRGVIIGSLLCAVVQAVLLGIGLAIAGVSGLWLLSALTFLFSMVPFVGAAGVWLPVTLWLLSAGEYPSATFLGLYGAGIVSTSDNLVRAYVLKGSSNMHPLVGLISVIGAIQTRGAVGRLSGADCRRPVLFTAQTPQHAAGPSGPRDGGCPPNRRAIPARVLPNRFGLKSQPGKSEIRISKSETNANDRNSNIQTLRVGCALQIEGWVWNIRILDLFRIWDFVLRICTRTCAELRG